MLLFRNFLIIILTLFKFIRDSQIALNIKYSFHFTRKCELFSIIVNNFLISYSIYIKFFYIVIKKIFVEVFFSIKI